MQTRTIQILLSNACLTFCSSFVLIQSNAFSMDESAYYVQHHSEHHRKGKFRHRHVYVEDNSMAYKLNRTAGRIVAAVLYTPIDTLNMVAHITGHVLNPHQEQSVHHHIHRHHRHHKHGKHEYHFTAEEYSEPEHHAKHRVPLKDLNIRHETYTGQDIEALGQQTSLLTGVLLAPRMVLGMLGLHSCCHMHCHTIHIHKHKHKMGHHKHGIKKHHHHATKHQLHTNSAEHHHTLKTEHKVYEKPIHHTPVKKDVSGDNHFQAPPKIKEPNQVIQKPMDSNPPPSYPNQPIMDQNQTLQPVTPQNNKVSEPLQQMLDNKNNIPVNSPIILEKPDMQKTKLELNKHKMATGQLKQMTHQSMKTPVKPTKILKETSQKQQVELSKHTIITSQHDQIQKASKAIAPVSERPNKLTTSSNGISQYLDMVWSIKQKISLGHEVAAVKKAIPKRLTDTKKTANTIKSTNQFKIAHNFYEYKSVQHRTFVPYQIDMAKLNYVETRPVVIIKSLDEIDASTNISLRSQFEPPKPEQHINVSQLIGQSIQSTYLINKWIFNNLGSDLSKQTIQLTSEDSKLEPKKDHDELRQAKHIRSWF